MQDACSAQKHNRCFDHGIFAKSLTFSLPWGFYRCIIVHPVAFVWFFIEDITYS